MKNREFITLVLAIVVAVIAGAVAFFLPNFPLRWTVAFVAVVVFVAILSVAQNVKRVLLFALTLITPFFIGVGLPPIFERLGYVGLSQYFGVQLIDILVLSLLLYCLARWVANLEGFRLYLFTTVPALAWILASAFSAIDAKDASLVTMQLSSMIELFLLYLVLANSVSDEEDIKWIIWALLIGIFFEGSLGIYQWLSGGLLGVTFLGEPAQIYFGRALGTIGNPNGYALYLAAIMPLGIALLFLDISRLYKVLVSIALGAGVLGLVFSLSRGGWAAFGISSMMVLVLALRRRHQDLRLTVTVVGVIMLALVVLVVTQWGLIVDRMTSSQANESALSRVTLARGAIAMIQDHPVLGVGLNNYSLFMPKYDPFDFSHQSRLVLVHNVYLLVAAETGLVGLLIFLWFLVSLFVQSAKLIAKATDELVWLVGVGALASFTALTVHGMVDYDMLANATVFRVLWLFAAIVAGLSGQLNLKQGATSHINTIASRTWRHSRRHPGIGRQGSMNV